MPEVLRQIEQIAWRINQAFPPPQAAAPEGRRAAFTLRLDAERHFRLKMAGVVLNRSAQVLVTRSEEHTSELQSLMRISYAVFCLKKKNKTQNLIQCHRL